jgi:N-acetylglucosamine-6-phosphate deacetylase
MFSKIKIFNGKIITPKSILENASLIVLDGKISGIEKGNPNISDALEIDAKGQYISPGFIDIHLHGGGGSDFMDGTPEAFLNIAETHAKYGTTAMFPTTLTAEPEDLVATMESFEIAKSRNKNGASLLGMHLEGPYFAINQKGAQDPRFIRNPEEAEYKKLIKNYKSIKRWSAAPELPGAIEFGRFLVENNILPAIAHTDAIYEEAEEAFRNGYTLATHFYSAMLGVTRRNAYRYAGVVEAAYLIDDMDVEIIADGALSSGTAALLDPYLDDPSSTGVLIWSDTEILEAATTFDALGYQLHIHAIGDAAVRQALDTIEVVITSNPTWDRRPVIAHAQLINPADLPRFNSLGVIANYQPLWTYMDSMNKELIAPRIGHSRNNSQYQLASMVRSGARVSYGSDWPVTSYLPLAALGVPTHRQTPDGQSEPWSPEESITVEQSLTFYTAGVAYQTFNEKRFGVIEVGMTADLGHLSANPLLIDPLQIPKIIVVATYKAGEQQ